MHFVQIATSSIHRMNHILCQICEIDPYRPTHSLCPFHSSHCVQPKKRKYEDVDDIHFDINDPLYGYTFKPRRSKRRRTKEELTNKERIDAPYCHSMEILIAAKLFVEVFETQAKGSTVPVTSADIRGVAANWDKIICEETLQELKNVANQVDDICSTKQIE